MFSSLGPIGRIRTVNLFSCTGKSYFISINCLRLPRRLYYTRVKIIKKSIKALTILLIFRSWYKRTWFCQTHLPSHKTVNLVHSILLRVLSLADEWNLCEMQILRLFCGNPGDSSRWMTENNLCWAYLHKCLRLNFLGKRDEKHQNKRGNAKTMKSGGRNRPSMWSLKNSFERFSSKNSGCRYGESSLGWDHPISRLKITVQKPSLGSEWKG